MNKINIKSLEKQGVEICIYCLGAYGMRTYLALRDHGITVSCFGDQDEKKKGYVIDGINCITYEEILKKDKRRTLIVVCKLKPEKIVENFINNGFVHVVSYIDINYEIEMIYGSIDYTQPDVINYINSFRKKIYQCYVRGEQVYLEDKNSIFCKEIKMLLENVQCYVREKE